jgi:outer membrane protein assembly factor BamB
VTVTDDAVIMPTGQGLIRHALGDGTETVLDDSHTSRAIVVGDEVYYTAYRVLPDGSARYDAWDVRKAPVDGSSASTPVFADDGNNLYLASDGDHVYWSNEINGAVLRTPTDAVTPEVWSSALYPKDVLVDDTFLYFVEAQGIRRLPKDGSGLAETFFEFSSEFFEDVGFNVGSIGEMAQDGDALYFVSQLRPGFVARVDKRTAQATVVVSDANLNPVALAVDDTHVYFVHHGVDGRVERVAKNGRSREIVLCGLLAPWRIALHDGSVYVAETRFFASVDVEGNYAEVGDVRDGRLVRVAIPLPRI